MEAALNLFCTCCLQQLIQTEVTHQLSDIFQRWEICGVSITSSTRRDYPAGHAVIYYRCPNCGFGIFSPMTVGTASFYKDITVDDYYLPDRWDFHVAINSLKKNKINSVLDLGCGKGDFLRQLKKKIPAIECSGNDNNPNVPAEFPNNIEFIAELSSCVSKFEAVTLFQVLEHVANPADMISDGVNRLKPGGLMFVSVPDHTGPIRFFADSHTAVPPHHVTTWTPESLVHLLGRHGLEILKQHTEPLPDYLMQWYLPEILINKLGVKNNPRISGFIKDYIADPIVGICKRFKIKSLPIKGHTLLVVARKDSLDENPS